MRLVIIGRRYPSDGVAAYTRQLEAHWRQLGAHVSVIHLGSADDGLPGDHVLPVWWRSPTYALPGPGSGRRLRRLLQLLKPDLVHAQLAMSPLDLQLPAICREGGWPLLGTMHTGWNRHRDRAGRAAQWLYRRYAPAVNRFQRVIVTGDAQRQAFLDAGVAPFRLALVPFGVDTQRYSPMHRPPRFDDPLRVTYLGRMAEDKGVAELVAAFQAVAPPNLVLTMAGDGPLRKRLEAATVAQPTIEWRGWGRDLAAKAALWRESDVVILPSWQEGLNVCLLEGMASGCMPVVTDVGAHREVVHGCGLAVNPTKLTEGLTEALQWLGGHYREIGGLGLKARTRIVEGYSQEQHWEGLMGVVEPLLLT